MYCFLSLQYLLPANGKLFLLAFKTSAVSCLSMQFRYEKRALVTLVAKLNHVVFKNTLGVLHPKSPFPSTLLHCTHFLKVTLVATCIQSVVSVLTHQPAGNSFASALVLSKGMVSVSEVFAVQPIITGHLLSSTFDFRNGARSINF